MTIFGHQFHTTIQYIINYISYFIALFSHSHILPHTFLIFRHKKLQEDLKQKVEEFNIFDLISFTFNLEPNHLYKVLRCFRFTFLTKPIKCLYCFFSFFFKDLAQQGISYILRKPCSKREEKRKPSLLRRFISFFFPFVFFCCLSLHHILLVGEEFNGFGSSICCHH